MYLTKPQITLLTQIKAAEEKGETVRAKSINLISLASATRKQALKVLAKGAVKITPLGEAAYKAERYAQYLDWRDQLEAARELKRRSG